MVDEVGLVMSAASAHDRVGSGIELHLHVGVARGGPERSSSASVRCELDPILWEQLNKQFVGRSDDPQVLAHTGDGQQTLNLLRAGSHGELLPALL